jgi:hypothetical protein
MNDNLRIPHGWQSGDRQQHCQYDNKCYGITRYDSINVGGTEAMLIQAETSLAVRHRV